MVERLALAKADKIAADHPGAIVLGSDQAAVLGSSTLVGRLEFGAISSIPTILNRAKYLRVDLRAAALVSPS